MRECLFNLGLSLVKHGHLKWNARFRHADADLSCHVGSSHIFKHVLVSSLHSDLSVRPDPNRDRQSAGVKRHVARSSCSVCDDFSPAAPAPAPAAGAAPTVARYDRPGLGVSAVFITTSLRSLT